MIRREFITLLGGATGDVCQRSAGAYTIAANIKGPQGAPGTGGGTGNTINVKRDFGAKGNNATDDTQALQNAINSASASGGRIYFPAGKYRITKPLLTPGGTYSALVFEGEGGFIIGGSTILGNFNDWLIKEGHAQTNYPVHSFINLCFQQNYTGPLGPDTEHTAGCIHMGCGIGTFIQGCHIGLATGVGIYAPNDSCEISSCNIIGQWSRAGTSPSYDSIGVWTEGHVKGCKIMSAKYGMVFTDFGGMASNSMVDTCYLGLSVGNAPIGWEQNPAEAGPGVMQPAGWSAVGKGFVGTFLSNESCLYGVYIGRGTQVSLDTVTIVNYWTPPLGPVAPYGLLIADFCDRSSFRNIVLSGAYGVSAIGLGTATSGAGRASNTKFENVATYNTSGAGWTYLGKNINTRSMPHDPIVFERCPNLDDAVNVSQLPSSPSASFLQTVKDSVDPVWTGSASNVGKPVTGGGTQRALVRWNGSAWVIAG